MDSILTSHSWTLRECLQTTVWHDCGFEMIFHDPNSNIYKSSSSDYVRNSSDLCVGRRFIKTCTFTSQEYRINVKVNLFKNVSLFTFFKKVDSKSVTVVTTVCGAQLYAAPIKKTMLFSLYMRKISFSSLSVRTACTGFDSLCRSLWGDSSLSHSYEDVLFQWEVTTKNKNKIFKPKNPWTCEDHGGLVLLVQLVDGDGVVQHRPARHVNIG